MKKSLFLFLLPIGFAFSVNAQNESDRAEQRLYFLNECMANPNKDCNLSLEAAAKEALNLVKTSMASEDAKRVVVATILSKAGVAGEPKVSETIIGLVSAAYEQTYEQKLDASCPVRAGVT